MCSLKALGQIVRELLLSLKRKLVKYGHLIPHESAIFCKSFFTLVYYKIFLKNPRRGKNKKPDKNACNFRICFI